MSSIGILIKYVFTKTIMNSLHTQVSVREIFLLATKINIFHTVKQYEPVPGFILKRS